MTRSRFCSLLTGAALLAMVPSAGAGQAPGRGQAPGAASTPSVPISNHDRVYTAEQFSNTITVTDPLLLAGRGLPRRRLEKGVPQGRPPAGKRESPRIATRSFHQQVRVFLLSDNDAWVAEDQFVVDSRGFALKGR